MSEPSVDVVMLGTGTSHGVPMIGCACPVCASADPRDQRTRASIFVRISGTQLLVDTTPELRLQCIANGIETIDAVLFTHHHADHIAGLDDVRRFNWLTHTAVPCYGTERTLAGVKNMFAYAFHPAADSPHSRPELELHEIGDAPFEIGSATIVPIPLMHGPLPVLGFRFHRFAYCTDCSYIPEASMRLLDDLDVLVLDGVRKQPHPTHFSIDQAVEVARAVGARQTFFTHMSHQLGHAETNARLPQGMALAYDGQRITLPRASSIQL